MEVRPAPGWKPREDGRYSLGRVVGPALSFAIVQFDENGDVKLWRGED